MKTTKKAPKTGAKTIKSFSVKNTRFSKKQLGIFGLLFAGVGAYLVFQIFAAGTALLTMSPASSNISMGSNFVVSIYADAGTNQVNAVQANFSFPKDKLEFVSVDATGSAFPMEFESIGNNTDGTVRLARSMSSATFVTGNQLVARVTFKAIGAGSAPLAFNTATSFLATPQGDNAVNVLTGTTGATYTVQDTVAPSTPGTATAGTRTVNSIVVNWTASTDNVGVTGYRVFRNGTQVGTPTGNTYTDTGLTPNTAYSYRIAAVDAAGNVSPQSTAASLTTLPDSTVPSAPTGLTSPTRTMTSVNLSWTASTDNVGVTGYRIYRGGTQVGTSTTTSFSDTGLASNTTYVYTVAAVDAAANVSAQSTGLSVTTLADTTAPTAPGAPTVTSKSASSVSLAWTASTDNVGVTGYRVYRNGTQVGTTTGLTYTDTAGITAGASFSYAVAAIDGAGNVSPQSPSTSVTILKPGDLNGDDQINIFDVSILVGNYGKTQAQSSNPNTDLNGDGTINMLDVAILLGNYGK